MREVSITVDVFAQYTDIQPVYRIYVDDDLMTERTYIWDNKEQYVRENIIVFLDSGLHTFKIEKVSKTASFFCKNFKVDKVPTSLVNNQFTVH